MLLFFCHFGGILTLMTAPVLAEGQLECADHHGYPVSDGQVFLPQKNGTCYTCTCIDGAVSWCMNIRCTQPTCTDYRVIPGACCNYRCQPVFKTSAEQHIKTILWGLSVCGAATLTTAAAVLLYRRGKRKQNRAISERAEVPPPPYSACNTPDVITCGFSIPGQQTHQPQSLSGDVGVDVNANWFPESAPVPLPSYSPGADPRSPDLNTASGVSINSRDTHRPGHSPNHPSDRSPGNHSDHRLGHNRLDHGPEGNRVPTPATHQSSDPAQSDLLPPTSSPAQQLVTTLEQVGRSAELSVNTENTETLESIEGTDHCLHRSSGDIFRTYL